MKYALVLIIFQFQFQFQFQITPSSRARAEFPADKAEAGMQSTTDYSSNAENNIFNTPIT